MNNKIHLATLVFFIVSLSLCMIVALTINSINALDNKTKDDSSSSKDSKSKSNKNNASSKSSEDNDVEASGKTDGEKSSTPKQQQTPSSNKNNINFIHGQVHNFP